MSGQDAAAVAERFVTAFGRADMTAVSELLSDDVTFQSPRVRLAGAPAVLSAMGEFVRVVTGVTVVAVMAQGDQAMVMYDMSTGPFGTLRAADLLTVVDGRITDDVLVFDTAPLGG